MAYFNPNSVFIFSGSNLNFVEAVKFGELATEKLYYMSDTGISGLVPPGAYTNDVRFVTTYGPEGTSIGSPNIVLRQADQVSVGSLAVVSGSAGGIINITGENFYQITDVNFGGIPASFSVVDSGTLEAQIPTDADYAKVTVYSSLRTGIDDDRTIASGLSADEFVPIPAVSGVNSLQLASGETFAVTGHSLSGVSGLQFGSLSTHAEVEASGSNFINFEVPSGDVRGVPNFQLYSGGVSAFPSSLSFSPFASVTGVSAAGKTGEHIYISGNNFSTGILYKTGDNYLASVMGKTGEFARLSHKVMSGQVPTGIPIFTSGGNLAAGLSPTISSGVVSLFSDQYPETYASDVYFTPSIGAPRITSISPSTGIENDVISIKGFDLYGITGVNLLRSAGSNVGIGTYNAGTIAEIVPGFDLSFQVGDAATLSTVGDYYDIVLSGFYGSVTESAGFFVLGSPTITSIDPSGSDNGKVDYVVPGATGLLLGTNLYSGTRVELWSGAAGLNPSNYDLASTLPSSGYDTTNFNQIKFNYPISFATGVNDTEVDYRIKVRNRRTSTQLVPAWDEPPLGVFKRPALSGFSPLSGEYGSTVTLSGYFEDLYPSGLSLGSHIINSPNQISTTGITFAIPNNSVSNTININTSGGFVSSTGILAAFLSKPSISGFYSGTIPPSTIDYNQVFTQGDLLTVSGERMHLATGVEFSGVGTGVRGEATFTGLSGASLMVGNFVTQNYEELSFFVPGGINPVSGEFKIHDFKGRETYSNSTGVNVVFVSGFTNRLIPGENFAMTGCNITGMDVLFSYATGGNLSVTPVSEVANDDGTESITLGLPTGIAFGGLAISGRNNKIELSPLAGNDFNLDEFMPLGVVTGVSGFDANLVVSTGSGISLTGINVFDPSTVATEISNTGFFSDSSAGIPLVGFSGKARQPGSITGEIELRTTFPISSYSTGMVDIGGPSDVFCSRVDIETFPPVIISGSFFIIDPWWYKVGGIKMDSFLESYGMTENSYVPYESYVFPFPSGEVVTGENFTGSNFLYEQDTRSYDDLTKKLSYSSLVDVTGTNIVVTGFGPLRGVEGTKIYVSGSGLGCVNQATFYPLGASFGDANVAHYSGMGDESGVITVPAPLAGSVGQNQVQLDNLQNFYQSAPLQHTGLAFTGYVENTLQSGNYDLFEVLPAAAATVFEVVPSGLPEPRAISGDVINYTAEEIVGDDVFLVTRTKFPDGSTMVVSSIPKP